MKNQIKLNTDAAANSYIQLFKVAQFNLRQVIKEEPRYSKKFNPRNHILRSSS